MGSTCDAEGLPLGSRMSNPESKIQCTQEGDSGSFCFVFLVVPARKNNASTIGDITLDHKINVIRIGVCLVLLKLREVE